MGYENSIDFKNERIYTFTSPIRFKACPATIRIKQIHYDPAVRYSNTAIFKTVEKNGYKKRAINSSEAYQLAEKQIKNICTPLEYTLPTPFPKHSIKVSISVFQGYRRYSFQI